MPVSEAAHEALKERVVVLERKEDVNDERRKTTDGRLNKVETIISRLTWLIVSAIVVAFMTFALNGGLHVARIS